MRKLVSQDECSNEEKEKTSSNEDPRISDKIKKKDSCNRMIKGNRIKNQSKKLCFNISQETEFKQAYGDES